MKASTMSIKPMKVWTSKFSTLLLLTLLINIPFRSMAAWQHQRITVNVNNVSLEEFISIIKQQCDVGFIYDSDKIKDLNMISIQAYNEEINTVLANALEGSGYYAQIEKNTIILRKSTLQQQKESGVIIQGKVVDKQGEGLPGVTVKIVNSSLGVTTDPEGNFKLSLPKSERMILEFSFVGMKNQQIIIKDPTHKLRIVMEDNIENLDEVVVTGIFRRNKESFTGSATTYSEKELKMIGNQNILQSLKTLDPAMAIMESKEFGSDPNRMPDIEIRGKTSIVGLKTEYESDPNQPLFILDGVETTLAAIVNLNMDRVASVTILKDAASAAIYGSKAANGVIVVETKQPTPGKLRLSYNGNFGVSFADLSDYNLMNAKEKLEFERLAGRYDGFGDFSKQLLLDKEYDHRRAQILKGVDTYWMNEPLRTVINHSHNIYADGGDEVIRYGIGFNYSDNSGVMKNSERKLIGGNIDLIYRNKRLLFSNKLSIDLTIADREPVAFSEFSKQNPYYRKDNDEGEIPYYIGVADEDSDVVNPLYSWNIKNTNHSNNFSIRDNFSAEWTIIDALLLRGRMSITKSVEKNDAFKSPRHPDFRDKNELERGSYSKKNADNFGYNGDINLIFGKLFADKHQINAIASLTLSENNMENSGFDVQGFNNDLHANPAFSAGFYENQKPIFSKIRSRSTSQFLNFNYAYDNRYLLDFNLRSDGTSVFGANKRFSSTWSLGLAWNIHREQFIKKLEFIHNLKIRGSVGNPGNQNFNAYQAQKTYVYNVDLQNMFGSSAIIERFGNKNLEWQRTLDKNIAIDLGLFSNRLRITVDYFHKDTDPLLIEIPMPTSVGTGQINTNLGRQISTGINGSITYTIIRNKDLSWNVNGNFRTLKSKYKDIGNSLTYLNGDNDVVNEEQNKKEESVTQNNLRRYYEGASPDDLWAVRSLGIDPATGREMFLKKDGTQTFQYSSADEVVVGSTRPDIEGVIGTSFFYKGFSASFNFRYRIGGKVLATALYDKVENISESGLKFNQDKRALYDRWQKPGDHAKFKSISLTSSTPISSRFVFEENTFAGESISIGYESTASWVRSFGAEGLTLRAYMNDIFRISSFKEERGIEYPFARRVSFTLSVRF